MIGMFGAPVSRWPMKYRYAMQHNVVQFAAERD
jgi:hypothetical protein